MSDETPKFCEYCDCPSEAEVYDNQLGAWLCEYHEYSHINETGYCGVQCCLGYGCDQSC